MKPYSIDLRQKIVAAVDTGEETLMGIAEIFGVGQTFLKKLLRQRRETGSIEPFRQGGGPAPLIDAEKEVLIGNYVLENPDATLAELCDYLQKKTRLSVSIATMGRTIQKLELNRKKKLRSLPKQMKNYEQNFRRK